MSFTKPCDNPSFTPKASASGYFTPARFGWAHDIIENDTTTRKIYMVFNYNLNRENKMVKRWISGIIKNNYFFVPVNFCFLLVNSNQYLCSLARIYYLNNYNITNSYHQLFTQILTDIPVFLLTKLSTLKTDYKKNQLFTWVMLLFASGICLLSGNYFYYLTLSPQSRDYS